MAPDRCTEADQAKTGVEPPGRAAGVQSAAEGSGEESCIRSAGASAQCECGDRDRFWMRRWWAPPHHDRHDGPELYEPADHPAGAGPVDRRAGGS